MRPLQTGLPRGIRTAVVVCVVVCGSLFAAGLAQDVHAQALSPGSSIILAPTVPTAADGTLFVGFGQLPENVVRQSSACQWYPVDPLCPELLYFATLQFLPRLQVSLRYTLHETNAPQETGDRSLGAVYRLLDDSRWLPALAVGVRDVAGTRSSHATFVVARKELGVGRASAAGSVGYAFTVFDANRRELRDGPFGGLELGYAGFIRLLGEFDTRRWNAGVRITPVRQVWGQVLLMDLEEVGFSFGISLRLAR